MGFSGWKQVISKKKGFHRLCVSSRRKNLRYSRPNNGKSFTTSATKSLWGRGCFHFWSKNRPQKHKKRAILHTFQANGGGHSPPPSYATARRRNLSVFESSYHLHGVPICLQQTVEASHCPFKLVNDKLGSCEYQFS